jgi:hypothetical protein
MQYYLLGQKVPLNKNLMHCKSNRKHLTSFSRIRLLFSSLSNHEQKQTQQMMEGFIILNSKQKGAKMNCLSDKYEER